jgi:hypothetical protein
MRFALQFAVTVVVGSPLVGMLAGYLWARTHRENLTVVRANITLM